MKKSLQFHIVWTIKDIKSIDVFSTEKLKRQKKSRKKLFSTI